MSKEKLNCDKCKWCKGTDHPGGYGWYCMNPERLDFGFLGAVKAEKIHDRHKENCELNTTLIETNRQHNAR